MDENSFSIDNQYSRLEGHDLNMQACNPDDKIIKSPVAKKKPVLNSEIPVNIPDIKPEHYQSYSMVKMPTSLNKVHTAQHTYPATHSEKDSKPRTLFNKIFPKDGWAAKLIGITLDLGSSAVLLNKNVKILPGILMSIALGIPGALLLKRGFSGEIERFQGGPLSPQDKARQSDRSNKFFQLYDKIFPTGSILTGMAGLGTLVGGVSLAFGLPLIPGTALLSLGGFLGGALIQKGFLAKPQ